MGYTLLSFQLDYFPVLEVTIISIHITSQLKSSPVLHIRPCVEIYSTLQHQVLSAFPDFMFTRLILDSALYAVLYEHWTIVSRTIESCMNSMVSNHSWDDPSPGHPEKLQGKLTGMVVFKTVSELVIQYAGLFSSLLISAHMLDRVFNRFKTAFGTYPQLNNLAERLTEWFGVWAAGVQSQPPTFQDPVTSNQETCQLTIQTLRETIERLRTIIGREHRATESKRIVTKKAVLSEAEKSEALLARLEQTYDPPGNLRPEGPRHNNDFENIVQVRICPTSEELMCPVNPHLPVTVLGAPHHLPAGSMERLLDTQFRLLREDLT